MDIQRRLQTIFAAFTLIIIALFGVVAFRIALHSGAKEQMQLLSGFAETQAGIFSKYLNDPPSSKESIVTPWLSTDHNLVTLIVDTNGNKIAGTDLELLVEDNSRVVQLQESFLHNGDSTGYFHIRSGYTLIWARAEIASTPFYLIVARRNIRETSSVVSELGLQLSITAFIIIFIATSSARILSMTVARKIKENTDQLTHHLLHDNLTGLANRVKLQKRILELVRNDPGRSGRFVLFIMDLDRFKEINDTLGHSTGDQLLKQVGAALQESSFKADLICRLGGDEFALLIPIAIYSSPLDIAKQILSLFEQPFQAGGISSTISASVGAAIYPEHGNDPSTLITKAELAMYESKRNRLGFTLYASNLDSNNIRSLTLNSDLRRALENHEMQLYYQPKVNLRTNQIIGVEALMRWAHPTIGMITPSEFIPLAEQSDMIRHLTIWAIEEALSQCRTWRKMGYHLSMAVNLSARSLYDHGLPIKIAGLLAKLAVPADKLTLEITESAIMSYPQDALIILSRLNLMRVKLSIDDFGTGYSSLLYLKQMPVSQIKIDKSFVSQMCRQEHDAVIARSIIDLGHNMGCEVVAEGMEDSETMDRLKLLGCDTVQGFHISGALPAEELISWMKSTGWEVESAGKIAELTLAQMSSLKKAT